MSINKVLNRPMFRQTALKRGHLKPVKLFLGGSSTPALPNPMFGPPPPNMMQRFNARPSVRMVKGLTKGIVGIPQLGGYYAGDKVGQALGIESELARMPFGLTGAYAATKALPGLAALPAATSAAIIAGPAYLTIAGKMERDRINAMSPAEREAHKRKSMQFGSSYLDDEQFNEQFGNFKPKTTAELNAGIKRPDSRRPGPRRFNTDRLTETGNESEVVKGSVDIDKVVKNNDPNTPVTIGAADTVEEKSFKDEVKVAKEEKITNKQANTKVVNSGTNKLDKPGTYKAADGTEITSPVIELARKYRKELMAGQKSQAGLVFLANLASGLLSGKSMQGGLGGALEIFGTALGPAVNNYATIKLKENEMENEFMSDALELAQDELAAKNDLVEGGSGLDFESTGYIQFRDKNGKAINRTGGLLKDGTYVMAALGQVDTNGRQVYVPVPAGQFSKYFTSAFGEKEQGQTIRNLSGKYKALGIGKETIRILEEAAAKGETLGGPVGRFNLLTTRLGSALEDLGFSMFESKDSGLAKVNEMRDSFKSELMTDGMTEKEADAFLDKNFGSVDSQFKKTLKDLGIFSDQTQGADLERLAINETVLTYALANSLKDKDRLTQKDIQMAKELVNVFPLLRGQKQVVRSLEAVNERILGDIEASELIYSEFGGDTATLENFRRKYGLLPGVEQEQVDVGFQNESTIDLLEKFNKGFN